MRISETERSELVQMDEESRKARLHQLSEERGWGEPPDSVPFKLFLQLFSLINEFAVGEPKVSVTITPTEGEPVSEEVPANPFSLGKDFILVGDLNGEADWQVFLTSQCAHLADDLLEQDETTSTP